MLKILVCVKQVPDVDLVRMDPETGNLVREGVPTLTNPLDTNALEAAVQMKEKFGGEVTVITMRIVTEAHDLYEVRLLFEPQVAALACRKASDAEIDHLQELCDEMDRLHAAGEDTTEADIAFHSCLMEISRRDLELAISTNPGDIAVYVLRGTALKTLYASKKLPAMNDHAAKPLDPEKLRATLEKLIKH